MSTPSYYDHVAGGEKKFEPREEDTVELEHLKEPIPAISFRKEGGIEVFEERFDSQEEFQKRVDELLGSSGR